MNHRERVLSALNHKTPDRVPIDLGGSRDSGIILGGYERLKRHFNISSTTKIINTMMQVAEVDEAILEMLDIDIRPLYPGASQNYKEKIIDNVYVDEWGIERYKPESSIYYDQIKYPLGGQISITDIKNYNWPNPNDLGYTIGIKEKAIKLQDETDFAIVLNLPSPFIHITQFLRGFEDWFVDLLIDQKLITYLFDTVLDINLTIAKRIIEEVGEYVDIVMTSDDLAVQENLMMSVEIYRSLIKPRQKKYFDTIKSNSDIKILYHSCGSITSVLGDLIDIGVDAINPVQVSAKGMEPKFLKKEFGKDLSFWGGIDTQKVLPYGTVKDVRDYVKYSIDTLNVDGGFVLGSVHNIQPDVPIENILEMFNYAKEYSKS